MRPDELTDELSALLRQEREYSARLRLEIEELHCLQRQLISGLQVWRDGYERLERECHLA